MKFKYINYFIFIFLFFILHSSSNACVVLDDAGQIFRVSKPYQRIISLAPDSTENLFAIGAQEQVVGVIAGSDYPPAVRSIPKVGSYAGLDLEKIISLHPDLVIAWGNNFAKQLSYFKKLGIPIYVSDVETMGDISKTIRQFGCLSGQESKAELLAVNFTQKINTLIKAHQRLPTINIFYQLGNYSLLTINDKSWISQAFAVCNGKNVFAQTLFSGPTAFSISWEDLLIANPEAIFSDISALQLHKKFSAWTQLRAVKNGFLFNLNPDLINRGSLRLLDGIQAICQALNRVRAQNQIKNGP